MDYAYLKCLVVKALHKLGFSGTSSAVRLTSCSSGVLTETESELALVESSSVSEVSVTVSQGSSARSAVAYFFVLCLINY